jgi:hypothetical protein
MATSNGLGQFSRRMRVIAEVVGENAAKFVRRAAIAADQAVVLATPVDTGRARANWVTSIGRPRFVQSTSVDPGGGIAISQGLSVIAGYKAGGGGIFITNSLDYIGFLEEGSSRQAPNGMTRFAIQAAQAQLKAGGLLKGV